MDFDVISQGPQFIKHYVDVLDDYGVPMITPAGGLGAHINAREVVSHIPSEEYPAGSLVAALYLCGGLRFVHEPKTLRFFTGRLELVSDWPEKLVAAYEADFGLDQ